MKLNVTCVARDVSPAAAFEKLLPELQKRGHETKGFLKKPLETEFDIVEYRKELAASHLAMIGLSSTPELACDELRTLEEAKRNRADVLLSPHIAVFSDMRNCWQREVGHEKYRDIVDLLFVTNEDEVEPAGKLYPNAKVVAVGHPNREADKQPKLTRKEGRALLLVDEYEKLILCVGTKNPLLNRTLLAHLKIALAEDHASDSKAKVVFVPHPGDTTPIALYVDVGNGVVFPEKKDGVSSLDLLPAADLVVNMLDNMVLECAWHRKPCLCYASPIEIAPVREQLLGAGASQPIEEKQGIMEVARNLTQLQNYVRFLLYLDGAIIEQQMRQKEQYPSTPLAGTAVKIMADAIEALFAKG